MAPALIQIEGSRVEVHAWPFVVARLNFAPTTPQTHPAQTPPRSTPNASTVKSPGLLDRVVAGVSEWGWRHLDISVQPHRNATH